MSKKKYPPRVPRAAHGFRTQDLKSLPRGAWWIREWLLAIDKMRLGARMGRGRAYAEAGQVTSISAVGGHIEAMVTGSRPQPYTVKLDFAQLPSRGPSNPLGAMSIARILAGDIPSAVKEMFARAGVPLCPTLGVDHFWCNCPDWSHPCKHVVAVLYLLGDAMVRDPALLLRIRGFQFPVTDSQAVKPSSPRAVQFPLWKGTERFRDAISRICRRAGCNT